MTPSPVQQGATPPPQVAAGNPEATPNDADAFSDVFAKTDGKAKDDSFESETASDDSPTNTDNTQEAEVPNIAGAIAPPEDVPATLVQQAEFSKVVAKPEDAPTAKMPIQSTPSGSKPTDDTTLTTQTAELNSKAKQVAQPGPDKTGLAQNTVSQSIIENRLSTAPDGTVETARDPEKAPSSNAVGATPKDTKLLQPPTVRQQPGLETKTATLPKADQAKTGRQVIAQTEAAPARLKLDRDTLIPASAQPAKPANMSQPVNPWNMTKVQIAPTQPLTAALPLAETADGLTEITNAIASVERSIAAPQTATAAPTTAGPETARHVANQIAVAIKAEPGRATEIALNPPELGRVKLSMKAVDGVITLNVAAERQETIDLMRRHIDTLAQEFKSLGYNDISFSFSQQGEAGTDDAADQDGMPSIANNTEPTETAQPPRSAMSTTGLDLRL